jgi:DNA polymerase-1
MLRFFRNCGLAARVSPLLARASVTVCTVPSTLGLRGTSVAASPRRFYYGHSHDADAPMRITKVSTEQDARRVLEILNSEKVRSRYHACDTEVMDIDVRKQSPVGNGIVTCATVFVGDDVDFGDGPNLWIDNLDAAEGILMLFQDYFEDENIKKVWHNYSFDRHVMYNHGINVKGFGGDTMHMARLYDSSREPPAGYSLESLSHEFVGTQKVSMKDIFSRAKLKQDGTPGLGRELPPVEEIQRDPATRQLWIEYACRDARVTFMLREILEELLRQQNGTAGTMWEDECPSMWELYQRYYAPFGEALTDMERRGFHLNVKHLQTIEQMALIDLGGFEEAFLTWAKKMEPNAPFMNINSTAQKQQFFFAPFVSPNKKVVLTEERVFQTPNTDGYIEPGRDKAKKDRPFMIRGLGMTPTAFTATGMPQVSLPVLKSMCGELQTISGEPHYGTAYDFFANKGGGKEAGAEACHAIAALCDVAATKTMLGTFIQPLQEGLDDRNRVHCSLNLNTSTGRLSAKRPNLQNQPALEKDTYKVRDAFAAEEGNMLIVADYGQLELRVLAHMARCESMLRAFELGGDFHSRTAMGMHKYVQEAIDSGEVLLERTPGSDVDKPLLKDVYSKERQRAKILNFSIAYGKTARGLSQDFGTSLKEAKAMLNAWYSDRPEVLEFQKNTIAFTKRFGFTTTLMGRRRPLKDINSKNHSVRARGERAAINTPIQGGAADIVMVAMMKVNQHPRFQEIGWKMILQVHDEIITEGPKEYVEEAMDIVRECMEHPFHEPLLVDLTVDMKADLTWYRAK